MSVALTGDLPRPKVVVVMPAYNAEKTLRLTYQDLPKNSCDMVILVDDGSTDRTVEIARSLDLEVFLHSRNLGYGANQKTCYREALKAGADIVVMVHPDYQYDPKLLPDMIGPILRGDADIVLGSRLMTHDALAQGMPWWKYYANRILTFLENLVLGLRMSEYHTGYRAYTRKALELVPFKTNSDQFMFDQQFIIQAVELGFRLKDIPVRARYFPEASSAGFVTCSVYGLGVLGLLFRYFLHRKGLHQRYFQSLHARLEKAT